jgi:predicted permease
LVIGQMSVALTLASVAALLTRSLLAGYTADLGFDRKDILLVRLYASGNPVAGSLFYRQLKERVRALPGVKRVSLGRVVPFSPSGTGASQTIFAPGSDAALQQGRAIRFNAIDPDYFSLLGSRVLRGRGFTERDGPFSPRVMVINETMARSFWPNQDPIGQSVRIGSVAGELAQIIGVVQDAKLDTVGEAPAPYLYVALAQHYSWEAFLLVESVVPPATMAGPVRAELRALGVTPSRTDVSTLKRYIHAELSGQELCAKVSVFLGLLGLGLAAVGLYGVLAYAVNRRTQEIGIRLALGAQRRQVLTLVLKRGLALALLGAGLGVPMALAVSWAVRGFIYGVKPADPVSLAVSLLLLLSIAALATYFPARRATKVDPLEALRYE